MRRDLPTPPDIIKHPELPVLTLLEHTLEMTELALLGAYPDHWQEDPRHFSYEDGYVDAIFHHIHAFLGILDGYRTSIETRYRAANAPPPASPSEEETRPSDEDISF